MAGIRRTEHQLDLVPPVLFGIRQEQVEPSNFTLRTFSLNHLDFAQPQNAWGRVDTQIALQSGANLVPKLPLEPRNNGDDGHRFFVSFMSVSLGSCSLVFT